MQTRFMPGYARYAFRSPLVTFPPFVSTQTQYFETALVLNVPGADRRESPDAMATVASAANATIAATMAFVHMPFIRLPFLECVASAYCSAEGPGAHEPELPGPRLRPIGFLFFR